MRNVIATGAASSAANPILDFWTQRLTVDGEHTYYAPAVPYALAFQIWDLRNEDNPVQVFPGSGRQAVDLTADAVPNIVGRYAAAWTNTLSASTKGRYQIRWFYTPTSTDPEQVIAYDFDVLPAANTVMDAGLGYVLPSDMRAEGVNLSMASDALLLRRIDLASRFVERATGRSFMPTYRTMRLHPDEDVAFFGEPIIALSAVDAGGDALDPTTFRVANRHLALNLIDPDDRELPTLDVRVEPPIVGSFPVGGFPVQYYGFTAVGGPWWFGWRHRAIVATGLFGYTEYDGSPTGRTPRLIQHATKLIVMRELAQLTDPMRDDAQNRWRVITEEVRDQRIMLAAPVDGGITGDRAIDDILAQFRRPMRIASV